MSEGNHDCGLGNQGMFSRTGRFLNENYQIFKKKDIILSNSPTIKDDAKHFPKYKSFMKGDAQSTAKKFIENMKKTGQLDDNEGIYKALKTTPNPTEAIVNMGKVKVSDEIVPTGTSYLGKFTSRENHYLHKQNEKLKKQAPDPGSYRPKLIYKNVSSLPDYSLQLKYTNPDKFFSVKKKYLTDNKFTDIDIQASERGPTLKKIQGSVNIGKMSDRRDLRDTRGTRFVSRWSALKDENRSFSLKRTENSLKNFKINQSFEKTKTIQSDKFKIQYDIDNKSDMSPEQDKKLFGNETFYDDKSQDSAFKNTYNISAFYKTKLNKNKDDDSHNNIQVNTTKADTSYQTTRIRDNSGYFQITNDSSFNKGFTHLAAKHTLPFESSTGRKPKQFIKPKENNLDFIYKPNYDCVQKTPYFLTTSFAKITDRQNPIIGRNMEFVAEKDVGPPIGHENCWTPLRKKNIKQSDTANSKQNILKRSNTTIDFKKSLGRVHGHKLIKDASQPLFMLKKMTSRFGVSAFHEKSQELNLYSERGFCNSTNYNGFVHKDKEEGSKREELEEQYDEINEMLNRLIAKKQ